MAKLETILRDKSSISKVGLALLRDNLASLPLPKSWTPHSRSSNFNMGEVEGNPTEIRLRLSPLV